MAADEGSEHQPVDRQVSRLTPAYMAAIEPFRRFVVYPSMLGRIREAWEREYGNEATRPGRRGSS